MDRNAAVILSGGGAYGAYEIGVLRALFEGTSPSTGNRQLNPGVFTGTSVGAFNAAFLVSRAGMEMCTAIRELESLWRDELWRNGVFRIRAYPFRYLNPPFAGGDPLAAMAELAEDGGWLAADLARRLADFAQSSASLSERALALFNISSFVCSDPLRALIREQIDFTAIRASARALRVAMANWQTGDMKVFDNSHMDDETGLLAVLASTSLPGIFPPVLIEGTDPGVYVDGGLVMNTPMTPALDCGADELHVVYLDPDVRDMPLERLQNTLDVLDRSLTIGFAVRAGEDIETIRWINRGLELMDSLEPAEAAAGATPSNMRDFIRVAAQIADKLREGRPYRPITVHRYYPRQDLGGVLGFLSFRQDFIERLIEQGYTDAAGHDCQENRCVLPAGPTVRGGLGAPSP